MCLLPDTGIYDTNIHFCESGYKHHNTGFLPILVLFNFLTSTTQTWLPYKLVSWEQHLGPETMGRDICKKCATFIHILLKRKVRDNNISNVKILWCDDDN